MKIDAAFTAQGLIKNIQHSPVNLPCCADNAWVANIDSKPRTAHLGQRCAQVC